MTGAAPLCIGFDIMDPDPLPRFTDTLSCLLRQAGVDRTSVIRIMGPGGLATLLWFCRHDYEQVGYLGRGPCPSETCDLLIVLQGKDQPLDKVLQTAPALREGGMLVVQTCEPAEAGAGADPIAGLLDHYGYRQERCVHGRHRELHVARRDSARIWGRAA
jgi:hypothetical protein